MITDVLKNNPSKTYFFHDNERSLPLMVEIGAIDKFLKSPDSSKPWVASIAKDYVTHFVIGFLYSGFPNERDNGYVAYCLPKTQFTPEQAEQWFLMKQAEIAHSEGEIKKIVDDSQSHN